MKNIFLFTLLLVGLGFAVRAQQIRIDTEAGPIVVRLYPDKAPVTVANFLRYVDDKRYDSAHFYRVVRLDNQATSPVKIEVIQGGLQNDTTRMLPPIAQETTAKTGLKHLDGTLSLARGAPNSGASEFFICINPQPELDFGGKRNPDGQGFAAFGQVISGMDVVRKIQAGQTGQPGPTNAYSNPLQLLLKPVLIRTVRRVP
ncbi:peptidylprolyl isomerase [Spirosoma fluviale]|uniref:Peptidyl-prolyl cis-trans isomerase n=1 Tax=Spirosoma fluviale TaxID=1597977 RepID=A0A286G3T2_9BACT|nr:peptidylprolyl isomerase [Spirosoma fluviale]SOD89624.1 peptidyl-prolyl cis-trans isomerase A (cyclophilin A) [Spirosoma fluviale]